MEFTVTEFRENLSESKLIGSRCTNCGKDMLPPRPICPDCGSTSLESSQYHGKGVLKAVTEIHIPLTKFKERTPYNVGIVQLDEGVMIGGMILGEDRIKVGSNVEAVFLKEEDGTTLAFCVI